MNIVHAQQRNVNLPAKFLTHKKAIGLAAVLLTISAGFLAARIPLWAEDPQVYSDAWGYIEPALTLLKGDFSLAAWRSERGPAYPLLLWLIFLVFGESNLSAVIIVQTILGAVITALLFFLGWKLTGSRLVAALASLAYALNVSAALFEISILSETQATFLAVCALGFGVHLLRLAWNGSPLRRFFLMCTLEGLICALLALSKHMFAAYSLVPAVFILAAVMARALTNVGEKVRVGAQRILMTFIILLMSVAAVGAWSLGNYNNYGWFTFSTLSGFNMSNVAGGFIEEATNEECADYINLYLHYRQREIARKNTHAMTLARAWVERIDPEDVSARVAYERLAYNCSLSAIQARPDLYLQTVRKSSDLFWSPAIYSRGTLLPASKMITDRIEAALKVLKILFTLALLLWLAAPVLIVRRRKGERSQLLRLWLEAGLVIFTVLYALVVSSATEFGENRRYKAPIEPFITLSILLVANLYFRAFKT
jgi:4-amino-4-deoxy-L-arabinose transferase-like glycosyltransferase